jgi:predicted negative regulator of RcsB-dependent stress response
MSEKIRRKELKRPDGVLTALRNAYQWAEENIKTLVVIGGLIFGAAVVWVTINHFQTEAKIKAFAAYLKAETGPYQRQKRGPNKPAYSFGSRVN